MSHIRTIIAGFLAIVISITVHEFAHALMADRLGDDTPRRHGRLTLNPVVLFKAHPFGALVMPLMGAAMGFFIGWAATPVNPARVRRSISLRRAEFLIAAAGPASNVLLGLLSVALFWVLVTLSGGQPAESVAEIVAPLMSLLESLVIANVILAIFNLLPIAPLDGFTVLRSLKPDSPAVPFLQQWGMIILLVIVMRGDLIFSGPIHFARGVLAAIQYGS